MRSLTEECRNGENRSMINIGNEETTGAFSEGELMLVQRRKVECAMRKRSQYFRRQLVAKPKDAGTTWI